MSDLETRLRTDLHAVAEDVRVSGDVFQENARRLAADSRRRGTHVLQFAVASVAAGLIAVTALVALPAHDSGDGQQPSRPAEASLLFRGAPVDDEAVEINQRALLFVDLSGSNDAGKNQQEVCYATGIREASDSELALGNSGCAKLVADASDASVVFDFLDSESWGLENPPGKSVAGIVDSRASAVTAYFPDGSSEALALHERSGGYHAFGMALPFSAGQLKGEPGKMIEPRPGDETPQRLVATAKDGSVLEAIDLIERFGDDWLPQQTACVSDPDAAEVAVFPSRQDAGPGGPVVWIGTNDAWMSISADADEDVSDRCVPLNGAMTVLGYDGPGLAGAGKPGPGILMVVVAPEVAYIQLHDTGEPVIALKSLPVDGSLWRVVPAEVAARDVVDSARIVSYDGEGRPVDERPAPGH